MAAGLFVMAACEKKDNTDTTPQIAQEPTGNFMVEFEHKVGDRALTLDLDTAAPMKYQTTNGQGFNVSSFGYFVSEIKLSGPNGELFEDEVNVGPAAEDVQGYYHIQHQIPGSRMLSLSNVPYGTYDQITFTLGVNETGIEAGAAGGVLDPTNGWFWNWNAGYIGLILEGRAAEAESEGQRYEIHVGGWKDIAPAEGESQKFVNNIKTITLNFDAPLIVGENLQPMSHIILDAGKLLDASGHDFKTRFSVHAPKAGQPYANQIPLAFSYGHSHQ